MASINLTKERITRLVEMAQNEETFSLKFNGVSIAVMCAEKYKDKNALKIELVNEELYLYYEGEMLDIEIYRRDDALIF